MIGDTIDTKADERRYNELLNQGFLPSQAIRKIETEKRLNVGIKPKGETDWNITIVKLAIVGLVLITGYSILTKKKTTTTPTQLSIYSIPGIDITSLNICKEKGLM